MRFARPRQAESEQAAKQRPPRTAARHSTQTARRPDPAAVLQRAAGPAASLSARDVMRLQNWFGNRAVGGLLSRAGQRGAVQPKPAVTQAGDAYEQEADRAARQAVRELQAPSPRPAAGSSGPARQSHGAARPETARKEEAPAGSPPVRRREPSGAPADSDLHDSIDRARGGGRSMAAGVRGPFEQVFGADFSGVLIHSDARADQLSRSIQAKAFTTGRDIFFSRGAYDPGSLEGRELLAHELAHVVQQGGGGAGRVVQRKVGFEFETGVAIQSNDDDIGYQTKIFTSTSGDWKIVADSSNMEFVTEPFPETANGATALGTAMQEMENWIAAMVPLVQNANPEGSAKVKDVDPQAGTAHSAPWPYNVYIAMRNSFTDASVQAAPQVTAGVTLSKIADLVDQMVLPQATLTDPNNVGQALNTLVNLPQNQLNLLSAANQGVATAAQEFTAATGTAAQDFPRTLVGMNINDANYLVRAKGFARTATALLRADADPVPAHNFKNLEGLLTLVISYLLVGHNQPNTGNAMNDAFSYSKQIAPLMSRVDFYHLYRLLADDEKAAFTEQSVLAAANLPGTGNAHMFARGFKHEGRVENGPTRAQWIDSIINGSPGTVFGKKWRNETDLMSQGSGSKAAENSSSLGAMHEADVGQNGARNLAVLELRRLPKYQHYTDWRNFALAVHTMFRNL